MFNVIEESERDQGKLKSGQRPNRLRVGSGTFSSFVYQHTVVSLAVGMTVYLGIAIDFHTTAQGFM